ncbi:hypothetical protein [Paractinoplanes hotanensis]|uniref:RelA/SpoT domain-containing protein n=1 Tax=Paractinoplanes hotanensis TaxID=2906497 RepID=A0ABT0Y397_9ACTN|nr:hypothetical protein [Actinoplanes hotanensis]MCM4080340.1 hypothetical protein [Actinoplanes hotanensis]
MPLPSSKKQLNKLGDRIAVNEPPAKEDLQQLNAVLRAYQEILVTVEEQLSLIGLSSTSRVKTRSVLIEKLRREKGMALARVQDLAGARTVVEGGWTKQDELVELLKAHFNRWTGVPTKVVDRRIIPSHGYRAVHLIVFPDGVPVEIQIRTQMQNFWAQIVEGLADRWGRGVRYGESPQNGHLPAEGVIHRDGSPVSRQRVIDDLRRVAGQIAGIEQAEREIESMVNTPLPPLEGRIANSLGREIKDLDADAARFYLRLRVTFKRAVN